MEGQLVQTFSPFDQSFRGSFEMEIQRLRRKGTLTLKGFTSVNMVSFSLLSLRTVVKQANTKVRKITFTLNSPKRCR